MLKGIYFTETELARLIGPDTNRANAVWVPQDRTTRFKKLPFEDDEDRTPGRPRRCVFDVEPWLKAKPEFKRFAKAVHLIGYL